MNIKFFEIELSKYHFTTIICLLMLSMTSLFFPYAKQHSITTPTFDKLKAISLTNKSITHLIVQGNFAVKTQDKFSPNVSIITTESAMKKLAVVIDDNTLMVNNHYNRTQINPPISVSLFLNKHLHFKIQGNGTLEMEIINDHSIYIKLNGYITGVIKGIYQDAQIYLYNAASLNARDLHLQNLQLSLTGASSAIVYVNNLFEIYETGYGSVTFYGHPRENDVHVVNMNRILPDIDYW